MSSALKTHLSALAEHTLAHPALPILKLPVYDDAGELKIWQPISYSQFQSDVEHFATHLAHKLQGGGIAPRSVVGLWSNGMSYVDVLYIYSIARAGYIPQLFSLRLPNPDVIYELLQRANAKAIIYEPTLGDLLSNCPYPAYSAVDLRAVDVAADMVLPPMPVPSSPEDIVMIFHTSGSTSGQPKLLPCNYSWLDNMVRKSATVSRPLRTTGQDVTVAMGSMCHIGQTFMFLASFQNGACTLQPRAVTFSTDELVHMIAHAGLNRLNQFPAFFAVHARAARHAPKLLALLQGLDEVLYSGQQMPREDEEWAYANSLQLRNLFGSTECGAMLLSQRGGGQASPALRAIEGTDYAFLPIEDSASGEDGEYTNANARLLELVVLGTSGDCPHPSMRAADGHFHTGDLFVEVAPGAYVNRGRGDDWIKSENCLRCDTRAIEDNARQTCADLLAECIVVGNGRPSPALFVEPALGVQMDDARLRREIIRRTRHFHARRYLHERITSAKMVVVVPRGTLPRTATKGNVRRRAVEEMFKAELDAMFA